MGKGIDSLDKRRGKVYVRTCVHIYSLNCRKLLSLPSFGRSCLAVGVLETALVDRVSDREADRQKMECLAFSVYLHICQNCLAYRYP